MPRPLIEQGLNCGAVGCFAEGSGVDSDKSFETQL